MHYLWRLIFFCSGFRHLALLRVSHPAYTVLEWPPKSLLLATMLTARTSHSAEDNGVRSIARCFLLDKTEIFIYGSIDHK